jgi:hypothetical protein
MIHYLANCTLVHYHGSRLNSPFWSQTLCIVCFFILVIAYSLLCRVMDDMSLKHSVSVELLKLLWFLFHIKYLPITWFIFFARNIFKKLLSQHHVFFFQLYMIINIKTCIQYGSNCLLWCNVLWCYAMWCDVGWWANTKLHCITS